MPRIDSRRLKIDTQNAKLNLDVPKSSARGQKVIPVSPKNDFQIPKIEYTSRIAADDNK